MPEFPAITHVALTVSDLGRSRSWYRRLFGSDPVIDEDTGPFHHVVWLLGGTLVGIHHFPDLKSTEPFDERRPGLDHLAFACANRPELETWERHLTELGIANGRVGDGAGEWRGVKLPPTAPGPRALAVWMSGDSVIWSGGPVRSADDAHPLDQWWSDRR